MTEDRFAAEGYKITQSVEIAGVEIIMADNPKADHPYMTWRRSLDQHFGAEDFMLPIYGSDYASVLREFIRTQSVCADNLGLERVYRGSALTDAPLGEGDCVPDGMSGDLNGKVVALRADILLPEYRACSHQLLLATGGFGCAPEARGRAVFGTNLYSGAQERWNRSDILGVVAETALPGWAHDKLTALRTPAEKESVLAKIREARTAAKEKPPAEHKPKTHDNSGPEL